MAQAVCNCNRADVHHREIDVHQAVNARHNTKNVVVGSVHTHRGGQVQANRVVRHRQEERGVINTGQVAGPAGLVLLGLESKGIHVDTNGRAVGVVLVGLDHVEVGTLTNVKSVVAVELDECRDNRVATRHALHTGHGVPRLQDGAVPVVGVVEGLGALVGAHHGVIAGHEGVTLDDPNQLLARVVEVQLQLVRAGGDRLTARELKNINEVLMGHLGELAALIRVQVDVVNVQGGRGKASLGHTVADGVGVGTRALVPAQVVQGVELQVDADLVVLEGDQGQRETRVAAEPELEGHVQGVHGRARANHLGRVGLTSIARVVARSTTGEDDIGELGHVANHLGIPRLLTGLLGELVPDVEPVTIVLVNALTADFKFHVGDKVLANPVEPTELTAGTVRGDIDRHLGQGGLEVDTVDQVAVALDSAGHLLAKVGGTIERVLNGLHGEVGVTTVNHFKKSDLWVTGKVNILGAIGNELHQTTTCHLYTLYTQNNFGKTQFFIRVSFFLNLG